MSLTQGGESNFSGRWLEDQIEWHAKGRGVPIIDWTEDLGNGLLFHSTVLVRRVPYKNIFGTQSRSEFVLHHRLRAEPPPPERHIRIECRVQETPGSVDEKLPCLFWNARDAMPENEIIIVMHGEGARDATVRWFKRQCIGVTTKTIKAMTISEYGAWFKALFRG